MINKLFIDVGVGKQNSEAWGREKDFTIIGLEPCINIYNDLKDIYPGKLLNIIAADRNEDMDCWEFSNMVMLFMREDNIESNYKKVKKKAIKLDSLEWRAFNEIHIWADIEGAELLMLKGATEMLISGKVKWINLEVRKNAPTKGWCTAKQVYEFLDEYGFKPGVLLNQLRETKHRDVVFTPKKDLVMTFKKDSSIKPLFLTFTNLREPYLGLAKNLGETIKRFDAGDFRHVKVNSPGDNRDFFTTSACLVYSYIIKEINLRPLIVLDSDNGLQRALPNIFKADWDIAACYRGPRSNENGRQDYNGGLIALNNKRPDVVRKFWLEWINRGELWEKPDLKMWPETLRVDGWKQSWWNKQSSLNQIIIPEDPDYKVVHGQSYVSHGYKIMPLKTELYGAKPGIEDAFIIHRKGGGKRK